MKKNKPQILMIHGGSTHKNDRDYVKYLKTRKTSIEKKESWAEKYLDKKLGKKFEIIRPRMPLSENAKYRDWKIVFERMFPFLRKNIILIGGSLGGIFLAKYLSENKFPKKIQATYLLCPPFDNTLPGEYLGGGFNLKSDLSLLEKNSKNLTLMFSKDDDVVRIAHSAKYREKLKNANIIIYESKNGHFKISKFPEIIKMIKREYKRI
jgi:predicted alpha/beta hydrolase family esterase